VNSESPAPNQPKPNKSGFFKSPLHLLVLVVVLASLVALALTVYDRRGDKTDQTSNTRTESGPSLSFSPATQGLKAGETLLLSVWEDSGDKEVNAVQAKFSFPTDKFDFVGIKTDGSAFEIEAQSSHQDGEITLARGHVGALTGRQLVATVELRSKESAGTASIKFINNSHLVSSVDNQDILISKQEAVYTVEAGQ
jgi:hypothetical protein